MCARRSENILFYFFADNFTGSKDTEPYKTDVSFLCQYMITFNGHSISDISFASFLGSFHNSPLFMALLMLHWLYKQQLKCC